MAVAAKKRGRPKGSTKKKTVTPPAGKGVSAPLPPPVEPSAAAAPAEEKKPSLVDSVTAIFTKKPEAPATVADYSPESSASSSSSEAGPLSAESLHLLGSVPETIGGASGDVAGGVSADAAGDAVDDPIAALMEQVAFEPQDVQDVLTEFFDWLAEKSASDHWRLTERQGRMLGRPLAQMLNSVWVRLQEYLPGVLGRWCESTPGALAFLMASGLVIGPKVAKQMQLSRERRKAAKPTLVQETRRPVAPPTPAEAPAADVSPLRPPGGGIVFDMAAD